MATDSSPAAVVRALYDALGQGDIEQAQRHVTPDFVWHEPLDHPWSGDHAGFAGLLAINQAAAAATDGTLALDVHDVLEGDGHAAIVQTVTAQVAGRALRLEEVIVVHTRDSALSEAWIFYREPGPARALFEAAPPPR